MGDPALAAAVAEIDRYVAYLQDPEKVWGHIATRAKLGELVVGHWATIRAALDQMSKREPTVEEKLADAKPVDPESLAADPPLSDEESEAFEQALRWPDDERMERLEGALRELVATPSPMTIAHGDLTGPTEPPYAYIVDAGILDRVKALLDA